jgi:uncharacterized membrane protein
MHLTPEMKEILLALAIFYVLLAGIGLFSYLKPPKKINDLYGYRTTRSMQNQANWDYAQKLFPRYLLIAVHAQLLVSLLVLFGLGHVISQNVQMLIHIILFCSSLIIVIPLVERKLARFDKQNSL